MSMDTPKSLSNGGWKSWLIGAMLGIIFLTLSGAGWLYADLSGRVTLARQVAHETDLRHSERLTRLEEQYRGIKESLDRIERSISRPH